MRAVKAPGYGDRRKAMLEDIAILTGGTADLRGLGIQLETLTRSRLGRAKKVVVDKDNATIIEGSGKSRDIKARIDQIAAEIAQLRPATTIARSSKSVWPSWPAEWPRSTSEQQPKAK